MRPAFLIFQFTPLREGRPGQAEEQLQRWMISIHAPPRGATHKVILRGQNIVFISIHAPPRGATPYARCIRASRDISIHAPPRGATATAASTETPSRFQFTPLREGRRASGETSNGAENFNSRPSARGDGQQGYLGLHQGYFNSRPSARGDKSCPNRTATSSLFQFTPLREGRHPLHECNTEGIFISIHAPPRGATCEAAPQHRYLFLFQFTPLREGRQHGQRLGLYGAHFNSRPSARGDLRQNRYILPGHISIHAPPRGATSPAGDERRRIQISIHAPPRGATAASCPSLWHHEFQFTPLREGRPAQSSAAVEDGVFQFTPLREGRQARRCLNSTAKYFNSRPSARGDGLTWQTCRIRKISIHAPPRGATKVILSTEYVDEISIHAPPRGATAGNCDVFGI